jgi:hypothetical protein
MDDMSKTQIPSLTSSDLSTITLSDLDTITIDNTIDTFDLSGLEPITINLSNVGSGGSGYANTYSGLGGAGIYSSPTLTGSYTVPSTVWSTNVATPTMTTNNGVTTMTQDVEIKGNLKVNGTDIGGLLAKIEERLAIYRPEPELEEKWEELRELSKRYKELVADIREKEKIWDILKK